MALTAAIATAFAAVCAAAAIDASPLLVAAALTASVLAVALKPDRRGLPPFLDGRRLLMAGGVLALAAYVTGLVDRLEDLTAVAPYLLVAVVVLSMMWPATVVIRACVVLAAASMVGAAPSIGAVGMWIAGVVAGSAVALVATHRQSADRGAHATAPAPVRRRQVSRESAALFVVAGLVALLVASLLPPPSGGGMGEPSAGRDPRGGGGELPPYLHPTDRLDAGGEGDGEGKEIVFRVKADYSSLWRTMTFDSYDGRTWRRSPELEPDVTYPRTDLAIEPGVGDEENLYDFILEQQIRVETGSIGVLPAAALPAFLQLARPGVAVARDTTLYAEPLLGKGATYVVDSYLSPSTAAQLRDRPDETVPGDVARFYLEFAAIPTRVRDLAAEITAGAANTYDKAKAIQDWMTANTELRSGTPPLPPGEDPVDRFLFVDRAGSSQQAASAMAVMLRTAGVPARLAVGYLPGNRTAFGDEFVVRARHATTWVEVWFPFTGWVPFDPGGRFLGPEPVDDSLWARLGRLLRALWWILVVVAVAVAAWLVWRLVRRRRDERARPWVTRCYQRLTRAGDRHGRPRQPEETPAEYCEALATALPDPRLTGVGELLTVAAYSGREPPAGARGWADEVVGQVERTAPRKRRRGKGGPAPTDASRQPEMVGSSRLPPG